MPPPREVDNFLEGPGDWTTTATVHSDTYAGIDPKQFDFSGKAVLVTGASRGIGREIAVSFAKARCNFIALIARGDLDATEAAIKAVQTGAKVLKLNVDLADRDAIDDAVVEIEKTFGRLDVVVNNAGLFPVPTPLIDSDPDIWWKTFELNLRAPYLVTRATLGLLKKTDGLKTYVNVSSVASQKILPGGTPYNGSKFALLRLTEGIAAEYGADGVVAVAIHPGNLQTEMTSGLDAQTLNALFTEKPALPADTIVWISAGHRTWMNGRYFNVTWNMLQLEAKKDLIVESDLLKMKLDLSGLSNETATLAS